jgi:hypothetical protein
MERFVAQVVLLLLVQVYAWRRGGWPERAAATAFLASLGIDQVAHQLLGVGQGTYLTISTWHFSLDCLLLVAVLAIGLRARRLWTIWLGSLQILAVFGHVARVVDAQMNPLIYAILGRYPYWLALIVIAWGTRNYAKRNLLANQQD